MYGSHTRENMAIEVTKVVQQFGLKDRIVSYIIDNALNNKSMFAKLVELKDTLNDEFTTRSTDFDTTLPPIDDDNDDDYALAMPYDDDYTLFDAILEATKDDATRDMVFVPCLAYII